MTRGLKAPLSQNEETTLRRISQGTKTADLPPRDVERLLKLAIVEWQANGLVLSDLGRQRLEKMPGDRRAEGAALFGKPKPALSYNEEDVLPPARAAAQAQREADLRDLLTGDMVSTVKNRITVRA